MDERRRVERITALPPLPLSVRQRPELLVDQRKQRVQRRGLPAIERFQQPRDLLLRCMNHSLLTLRRLGSGG